MPFRLAKPLALAVLAGALAGCVAAQVRENTLEMVGSVARIRELQVLRNLSAAISDHDMVPTQILLSTGQASVAAGLSPSLKAPQFRLNSPTREVDVGASDSWTAQWQVTPVTNGDDLRRLRNLYVLVVWTDERYNALESYFNRHPEMRAPADCYGLQSPARLALKAEAGQDASAPANLAACPAGYGEGQIPRWREALAVIEKGDSIGCKLYQEAHAVARKGAARDENRGVPFRRWLYWRTAGSAWLPIEPETTPQSLGTFGGWKLATTSRACFDDFVILVQSSIPETANASAQGAKVMLGP